MTSQNVTRVARSACLSPPARDKRGSAGAGASRVGRPLVLAGLLLRNALEERDDVLLGALQGA